MAKARVADLPVETLVATGVQRIDGVAGECLNGITDASRRRAQHVRHRRLEHLGNHHQAASR
jgi:hypothetical protein